MLLAFLFTLACDHVQLDATMARLGAIDARLATMPATDTPSNLTGTSPMETPATPNSSFKLNSSSPLVTQSTGGRNLVERTNEDRDSLGERVAVAGEAHS